MGFVIVDAAVVEGNLVCGISFESDRSMIRNIGQYQRTPWLK